MQVAVEELPESSTSDRAAGCSAKSRALAFRHASGAPRARARVSSSRGERKTLSSRAGNSRRHRLQTADPVPEILEIRGVQSSSAIKTLPTSASSSPKAARRRRTAMMYGTSKEFLMQFGLRT